MALTTSPQGYTVIRSFEGRALKAYRDEVGVWTIGYGQTNNDASVLGFEIKAGTTITAQQAEDLLKVSMVRRYEPAVNKAMGPGNPTQAAFDAGGSFHYNTGAIERATWVKDFVAHDTGAVRPHLMQWNKAGGNVLAGLTRRRAREADMILLGDYGPEGKQSVIVDERGKPVDTSHGPQPSVPPVAPDPSSDKVSGGPGLNPITNPQLILDAYKKRGYPYAEGADVYNLLSIEGMNADGTTNGNRHNAWDDLRVIWQVVGGKVSIIFKCSATTEPGAYWTDHPMNADGAFHIALGYQAVWVMGSYHGHRALVEALPITGTRDKLKDYKREGKTYVGDFGVHIHAGYNYKVDDIGRSSAGCQVIRLVEDHDTFMGFCLKDARYLKNKNFVFGHCVMAAAWVTGKDGHEDTPLDGTVGSLGVGCVGPEVADYQRLLIAVGYDLGPKGADGIFGIKTSESTVDYQKRHPQLKQTGIADPATRTALKRAAAAGEKIKDSTGKVVVGGGTVGGADAATGFHLPTWSPWLMGACAVGFVVYMAWQYRDEIRAYASSLEKN
jgi:GH24 family phage-related lysozyme (muramidase)